MPPKKKSGVGQKGGTKRSGYGRFQVDLMMECEDEELSPAQLIAMKKAQEDHDKANDMIKAARAGNTLVPSTKPNTFTLVPPKQPSHVITTPPANLPNLPSLGIPASKTQSPASNLQVIKQTAVQQFTPQATLIQKQLSEPSLQTPTGPPPRPQQYLDKHQKKKEDTSPDIMIIGESPPRPNSKILMNQNVKPHQIPVQQAKIAGATPTQVYKFVSPHGTSTQIGGAAQWLIRPVLTVTPQQLQQQQGKQQVQLQQQQAATSSNQFYLTSPPGGNNPNPGVQRQEHSILRLTDWLTRAEYTRNIPCQGFILFKEIYTDELFDFIHYQYSQLEKYRVRKRGEVLKYYLNRFFKEKRKLELKLQMDAFFSNKSDVNTTYSNKENNSGPITCFKSHSNDQICDKNLITKSAFMSGLLTLGYKAEPTLICDKHKTVAYRYMHNQEKLRKVNYELLTSTLNNRKRLNFKGKNKEKCGLIAPTSCDHCETVWKEKRKNNTLDNFGRRGTHTCWKCVLISHHKDVVTSTAFIRPLSKILFVYPLHDFKGTSKPVNQFEKEGSISLVKENEQTMLFKKGRGTSDTSYREKDDIHDVLNVSMETKDENPESLKINKNDASGSTSFFYASLNGDINLSEIVNRERNQDIFDVNGKETGPNHLNFEENRSKGIHIREDKMESLTVEELLDKCKQFMSDSANNPWYKDLADCEIRYLLRLCQNIGWTSVSKVLHIPKMQLFTWNREFRKFKMTGMANDVADSSLSAQNADITTSDDFPPMNNNSKCLEKSSQNYVSSCIEDESLQRGVQTSSDSQSGSHSAKGTNKSWEDTNKSQEDTAFTDNCNTDGRLHPPTSIKTYTWRNREVDSQNKLVFVVELDKAGKKKMSQESMNNNFKPSTSDSLSSIIGRLQSKLKSQTTENLQQSLTGSQLGENVQAETDNDSSNDDNSNDSDALVIDDTGKGGSSAQDTEKEKSEVDESKKGIEVDQGNPSHKDDNNCNRDMRKSSVDKNELFMASREEEIVQKSAAKTVTTGTYDSIADISRAELRKDFGKVLDICPTDHCYFGTSSVSKNVSENEKMQNVPDIFLDDAREKDIAWKPVDDNGKLTFPQNEWFTLNGRKIRVFSTFTDHKRQQLQKRIEKKGITQVSTKLKIPAEYLKTVLHTVPLNTVLHTVPKDGNQQRSQNTIKQPNKMHTKATGGFVSLSGVIDKMYAGQHKALQKNGSVSSDIKVQAGNNKSITDTNDGNNTASSNSHTRTRNITKSYKEMVVKKSYEIGRAEACKIFQLNPKTLTHWRNELVSHAGDDNKAKTKEPLFKRVMFPHELKMKLAFLSLEHGVSKVCKQYNVSQKSLKSWIAMFKGKPLSSSEFTEDELKILIAHNEAKASAVDRRNQLKQLTRNLVTPEKTVVRNSLHDIQTETLDFGEKSRTIFSTLPVTSLSSGEMGQSNEKAIEQSDSFEEICSWQIQANTHMPSENFSSTSVSHLNPNVLNSGKTNIVVKESLNDTTHVLAQPIQQQVLNQDKVQHSAQFPNSDISVVSAYYGVVDQARVGKIADKIAVGRSLIKPQHIKKERMDLGYGETPNQVSQQNNLQQSELLFSTRTSTSSHNSDFSMQTPVSVTCEVQGTERGLAELRMTSFPVYSSSHKNSLRNSREDDGLGGMPNSVGNFPSTVPAHINTPLFSSGLNSVHFSSTHTSSNQPSDHVPVTDTQKLELASIVTKSVDASKDVRPINLKGQTALTVVPVSAKSNSDKTVTPDADASPQIHQAGKVIKSNQLADTGKSVTTHNDITWMKRSGRLAGIISDKDIEIEKSLQSVLMSLREKRKKPSENSEAREQQGLEKEGKTGMNVSHFKAKKPEELGENSSESTFKGAQTGRITNLINKISNRLQDAEKGVEIGENKGLETSSEASTDTAFTSDSNESDEKSEFAKDTASDNTPNISEKLKSLLDADIFRNIDDEKVKDTDTERADSPYLSEKLKSLLNADIFANIEEKSNNENDTNGTQDLTAISSESYNESKVKSDVQVKESSCTLDVSETTIEHDISQKKVFYSVGLKIKLAHLCMQHSSASVSRKYNISLNSLKKWKKMYQNEEVESVEFTPEELSELECIKGKRMLPGKSSAEKYDIYIDNPESDSDCVVLENSPLKSSSKDHNSTERNEDMRSPWKSVSEKMNFLKASKSVENSVPNKDETKEDIVFASDNVKSVGKDKSHFSRVPNIFSKRTITKSLRKSTPLVENYGDVPLYFALDETVSDETKKQIREKVVKPSTNWPKGVFLESACTGDSFSSQKEHAPSLSTAQATLLPVAQTSGDDSGGISWKKSAQPFVFTVSSEEEESCPRSLKRKSDENYVGNVHPENPNAEIGSKQSDLFKSIFEETNHMIAELNSDLSPKGLKSNSTISSKNVEVNVCKDLTDLTNPSRSIRYTDLKSHFIQKGHTVEGITIAHETPEKNEISGTASGKKSVSPKSVHVTLRRTLSTESSESVSVSAKRSLSVDKADDENFDRMEKEGSFLWKWKKVREARVSGFENTAKLHKINMTDIMKWHDDFLKDQELKLKLASAQHALLYGLQDASNYFKVSKEFISNLFKKERKPSAETDSAVTATTPPIELPVERQGRRKGLEFETVEREDGKIKRPKFQKSKETTNVAAISDDLRKTQKTRMGPNSINYTSSRGEPLRASEVGGEGFNKDAYIEDTRADLGTMPRVVKQPNSGTGDVEIASTWKQIQSVVHPQKTSEKKYTQDFKNKIIKECEEKGQKVVSKDHRIPYNEISRWRLEAKKALLSKYKPVETLKAQDKHNQKKQLNNPPKSDSVPASTHVTSEQSKDDISVCKQVSEASSVTENIHEKKPSKNKESLKIKIKLSKNPEVVQRGNSEEKSLDIPAVQKQADTDNVGTEDGHIIQDENAEMKLQVVNYCIQYGVLKTQKKFGLIRQSIVDLMQEYDNYLKTAFNHETRSQDVMNFHTKLVTREKTSVEESVSQKPPVIMHNLKDYIVTQEYKDSVAEYAREHGITAATRKFKRKPSTVKSWMGHYAQKLRKIKKVEELMKQAQAEFGIKGNETEKIGLNQTELGSKGNEIEQNTKNSLSTKICKVPESSEQTSMWAQDFVIKPSSGDSPLKMTLSPRRSVVTLSTDEEQRETDSEGGDATEEYEEVTNMEDSEEPESMDGKSTVNENHDRLEFKSNTTLGEGHGENTFFDDGDTKVVSDSGKELSPMVVEDKENDILISPTDIPNILEISGLFSEGLDESKKDETETNKSEHEADGRVDGPGLEMEGKSSAELEQKTAVEKLNLDAENERRKFVDQVIESLEVSVTPIDLEIDQQKGPKVNVEEASKKVIVDKVDDVEPCGEIKDTLEENELVEEKRSEPIVPKNEAVVPKESVEKKVPEVRQLPIVEEVKEFIPYEDSLMFKLYTTDVDLFFRTTKSVTVKQFQNDKSESFSNETASKLDSARGENNATELPDKGSDFEVVNKEETCLQSPASRQDIEDHNSTKTDDDSSMTKNEGHDEGEEHDEGKENGNIEDDVKLLREELTNKDAAKDSKEACIDIDRAGSDQSNKVEKERSLFDFFSFGKEQTSEEKEKAIKTNESKNSSNELTKENTDTKIDSAEKLDLDTQKERGVNDVGAETSAFSLFGNLMKSFKIPKTFPAKKEEAHISKPIKDLTEPLIMKPDDIMKKTEVLEVTRAENKTERNLFDFILPSPARESELNPAPETTGTGNEEIETKKAHKSENILPLSKINPVKSIFKFNKLPVNFGNIAKLGMAQLKKDDVKMKPDESINQHLNLTCDDKESKQEVSNTQGTHKDTKLQNVNKDEISKDIPKPGVIMETFEELRRRLAQERAANKLEKESKTNIDSAERQLTMKEPEKEKNADDVYVKLDSFSDFPPQKVTLIVDIAKKHGIEFASSSFGLPPVVIVNWIIEKDRKHRKITAGTTLEMKLLVVGELISRTEEDIDQIAQRHKVGVAEILTWKREFQWLMERKDVEEVVDKWKNVESMQSLENPTRKSRGSFSEKVDLEKDASVDEVDGGKLEQNVDEQNLEKLEIHNNKKTEKPEETKHDAEGNNHENQPENPQAEGKLPDVLSFTLHLHPRDYSLEQKAMIVLLVDKFGIKEVHNKLGINKGTLWTWKNQNRFIKQLLHEQRTGVRITKVIVGSENLAKDTKSVKRDNKNTLIDLKTSGKVPSASVEEDIDTQPPLHKGYRLISPSKIPPILRNARNIPTKDFTFEQRVAIVQLVELYGVRTIHKQFRIPQGSIWNWQHSKNITEELKKDEKDEEVEMARRHLQFGIEEGLETDSLTIDTILDRVLITVETVNHLNFNSGQKSDVVCLIDHFGLQYVCNKLPQIPRGTLWNWNHNKHVRTIVERKMAMIQKSQDKTTTSITIENTGSAIKEAKYLSSPNKQEGPSMEVSSEIPEEIQATVSEVVDKAAMTQNWVSACQQGTGLKRKAEFSGRQTWNSGGYGVKTPCIRSEKSNEWQSNIGLDGVCSEKDFFRSLGQGSVVGSSSVRSKDQLGSRTRASSISSISSAISDQTSEFEEILSEDELNTSSNYSKISGKDSVIAKNSELVKTSLIPRLKWSFLSALPMGMENTDLEQALEILQIEEGSHSRLMVSFKFVDDEAEESASAKKKSKKDSPVEFDSAGHWVPLDEYYYGTVEGDASYTEEKGEYRFKCWYCSKMLYNNVRAMQHIQAHIDSTKQLNIDLSDLTQCKHCYKQFDTPFEMQTHVEKVHLSNKVLMCRICEKDFGNTKDLIVHMRQNHLPCEMPYHCQLCGFRSSMYSDVVDHFKKKHDSSSSMLCLYCLRVFRIKFVSQGWGQTQTYYGHLLKHQTKSSMKKCNVCRLMFFNPLDVKNHRKNSHTSYKMDIKALTMGQSADDQLMIKVTEGSSKGTKKESKPKSLNAPSISKIQDYGGVSLPFATTTSRCIECKMTMSSTDHYKKHINCSLCRFATSCSVAYANHMMGFHSGQVTSLNLNIPWERPMKQVMFCSCGFSSKYGTKMANHLVFCGKHTCSGVRPNITDTAGEKAKDEGKKEGGIFGALGLVQKKTVTTRMRALDSGKSEPKSEGKKEKQSSQEFKQTSLKPETSSSTTVIHVDSFKSSAIHVDVTKQDTKKEDPGTQQIVKEDVDNKEKEAIEGNKNNNDNGNQFETKDRGVSLEDSTDDVKKPDEAGKDEAADAAKNISNKKEEIVTKDILEKSDELLNKDKLVEKVDADVDANESNKSVDEADEGTNQAVSEAIQLDNYTEDCNVQAKQLTDKPEGTKEIDVDDTRGGDAPDAIQIDDTEGDAEKLQFSVQTDNKKKVVSETRDQADKTAEQMEEDISLEEDADGREKKSELNNETQETNKHATDENMADKVSEIFDKTEITKTVGKTDAGDKKEPTETLHGSPQCEDAERMETDQIGETEISEAEQQDANKANVPESEAISAEAEDIEMKDTADEEQENPTESEELSQMKENDPDLTIRSDKEDDSGVIGEQEGDDTTADTDVALTEGSKDMGAVDQPDKPEPKAEDSEANMEEDKFEERKQETSQIERPRQSSVDSQKSDRSDRSSQGQQEHRSHSSSGRAHDERYRHGDRSHDRSHDRHQRDYHSGTQRSDDYRSYNRDRDRDRSHDRGYENNRRDNRYGYDNNRGGHGQNYRGHGSHRGQYGGHHYGNRGGYNQDRRYNRGGYGGGYRGGYY